MAGGGGAWKVAYADFVTAMMAFFLVMWITSQNDDVKKAIGGYFQDPWGTSSEDTSPSFGAPTGLQGEAPFSETPNGVLPNRWPQSNIENATDKNPGAASVWQQKHKVHLMNDEERNLPALVVNFEEAAAELPELAQHRLTDLLPALVGKRHKIELRAHSTRRPLPKDCKYKDHWELCYRRSLTAMEYLIANGIEPERIRLSLSGAFEPLTSRLESAWQNENNCVEVFLLADVAEEFPGAEHEEATANEHAAEVKVKPAALAH
jgi:chemotaxis protein MotB